MNCICFITIFSQNKNSLEKFYTFLLKKQKNIITIPIKNKKNHFSILKSPHVNKNAQEQFGFKFFSKKLKLYFPPNIDYLKHFVMLKKLKNYIFSDVSIKINFVIKTKKTSNNKIQNYSINILQKKNRKNIKINNNFKKTELFLTTLEIFSGQNF